MCIRDSLERALDVKVDDQNVKNYAKGFEMIYQQLVHILNQEGVKEDVYKRQEENRSV